MKRNKRQLTILGLPFKSILDARPNRGQFILMAWDIKGYSGFESAYWDNTNDRCKNCVLWMPLPTNHVYTRDCAVVTAKTKNTPLLKWSEHFAVNINGKYISQSKLRKVAEPI